MATTTVLADTDTIPANTVFAVEVGWVEPPADIDGVSMQEIQTGLATAGAAWAADSVDRAALSLATIEAAVTLGSWSNNTLHCHTTADGGVRVGLVRAQLNAAFSALNQDRMIPVSGFTSGDISTDNTVHHDQTTVLGSVANAIGIGGSNGTGIWTSLSLFSLAGILIVVLILWKKAETDL